MGLRENPFRILLLSHSFSAPFSGYVPCEAWRPTDENNHIDAPAPNFISPRRGRSPLFRSLPLSHPSFFLSASSQPASVPHPSQDGEVRDSVAAAGDVDGAGCAGVGLHVCMHRVYESWCGGRYPAAASPTGARGLRPCPFPFRRRRWCRRRRRQRPCSRALAVAPGVLGSPLWARRLSYPLGL